MDELPTEQRVEEFVREVVGQPGTPLQFVKMTGREPLIVNLRISKGACFESICQLVMVLNCVVPAHRNSEKHSSMQFTAWKCVNSRLRAS